MEITPQRANPGGNLAPEEVVGRDAFIASLWDLLERQSIRITAERRMGKTSVIKKMRAEAPLGTVAIYRSFEPVRSVQEFVELVLQDVRSLLPRRLVAGHGFRSLLDDLGIGIEAGPVHLSLPGRQPWKELVERVFTALDDEEDRVVFLWDEVPVMIGAIAEAEGTAAAQDLLHALRTVRQTCESIRMVFTGSVGLHHVLGTLRTGTYSSAPVNDMYLAELGGLEPEATALLTRRLLAGEQLRVTDEAAVITTMHDVTAGIPFYVQNVVAALARHRDVAVTAHSVIAAVDAGLHDPQDRWHLEQYRSRLTDYYGDDEHLALVVLDAVAVASEPLTFAGLVNAVHSKQPADDERVRAVLRLLEQDHYLTWQGDRCRFAFSIVGRAWTARRHL